MPHTLRRLLAVMFSLIASVPASAKPNALPPPVVPQCVGINIHFTGQPKQDMDGLARAGFGWIRMDFAWDAIEKKKGVYDFAAYDSLLAGLTERHIKPLFILDYGNSLYQNDAPRSPEARAAFARFASAAVRHYRSRAILWEIWNEPNGGFWRPQANVTEYGSLALATARAIKAADPNATVIAPGTSTIPLDFMESLFKQGLLNDIDAVSFHPYRGSAPETAATEYQALRLLIHRYSPGRDVPLVSSEWGYTTVNVSEQQQAQYLARQWLSNLAEGIRLSIWYDWHDDGTDPRNGEHNFGTVHNDYSVKPSFLAARTLIHSLNQSRFIKRVPLASPNDYLLLFARGSDALTLVAWTTRSDHTLSLPVSVVSRMTDMLGTPVVPVMDRGRLRLTLTGSPTYFEAPNDAALRQAASWTVLPVSPFYGGGQPLRLGLTYHNPDSTSHRVRFLVQLTTPDGARTPVPGGEDIIGPNQTLTVGTASAAVSRVAARARVGIVVDGVRQPYPQDVLLSPTDPLTLSVAPMGADHHRIDIENPGGSAFSGKLSAPGTHGFASLPVVLTAGQTTLTLTATGPAGLAWRLRDQRGRLVATLPPQSYVPYSLDASAVQTVFDGDLKVPSTLQASLVTTSGSPKTLRVHYEFAPGWSFWRAGEAQPTPVAGRPLWYGVWVHGDGSGNGVNIRFQDATGQTFQANGPPMRWSGWRYLTFALRPDADGGGNLGHWGGANDGQIHYPIRLTTLLLLDSRAEALRHQGTVLWKQPDLVYRTPPI